MQNIDRKNYIRSGRISSSPLAILRIWHFLVLSVLFCPLFLQIFFIDYTLLQEGSIYTAKPFKCKTLKRKNVKTTNSTWLSARVPDPDPAGSDIEKKQCKPFDFLILEGRIQADPEPVFWTLVLMRILPLFLMRELGWGE